MAVQVSYPGVYIEEFTPGAPIEGVGTATAAFLGPASDGPLNEATKITSLDAFLERFGSDPIDGFYFWYAVRGFFENGGQVCYVVRVSNGKFDWAKLNDRPPTQGAATKPTIRVQARTPGDNAATPLKVVVSDPLPGNAKLFRPTAAVSTASGNVIQVTAPAVPDAAKFLPGDAVTIEGGGKTDTGIVQRVENDLIRLNSNLNNTYTTGATVHLANLKANVDDTLRIENGEKLAAGSVLKLSQVPAGGGPPPPVEDTRIVKSVRAERISPILTTYRVVLKDKLTKNFALDATANDASVVPQEFNMTITQDGYSKSYEELSMDSGHPRYFAAIINSDPDSRITASPVEPPNTTAPPFNRPAVVTAGSTLSGGAADDPRTLQAQHYKSALALLEPIDDVNMIAIPDRGDADVQLAMIAHCEKMMDRFAILDSRRALPLFGAGSVDEQRLSLDSPSGYAAFYYPWLLVPAATGNGRLLVPPSGHVAGIYARTDGKRGVHKAPAGEEAVVNGALGVEQPMSDIDQGQLNLHGINVIRVFKGGGRSVVWGARTTATDKNWLYINVRRLFLFLEESIEEGIRWAVFEPNNQTLWKKLKRSITAFLTQQWRDGALYGSKPEEAFYVRIDEVLNPDTERALGRLHIEIGIRPSYPAEFIIVRIGIWQGGSEITEA